MSGSNDFTLLNLDHAEYHSWEPCGVLLLKRPALVSHPSPRASLACCGRSSSQPWPSS